MHHGMGHMVTQKDVVDGLIRGGGVDGLVRGWMWMAWSGEVVDDLVATPPPGPDTHPHRTSPFQTRHLPPTPPPPNYGQCAGGTNLECILVIHHLVHIFNTAVIAKGFTSSPVCLPGTFIPDQNVFHHPLW